MAGVASTESLDSLFAHKSHAFALVVSGPSGVGKTSVCKTVIERDERISPVVTTTTRSPREGEVDGQDYHFASGQQCDSLLSADEFLEHAIVHGNRYGTTRSAFRDALGESDIVLLEIDVQGAESLRQVLGDRCVTLFILPPSLEELRSRLAGRNSEGAASLKMRTDKALEEMACAPAYDYVIVNRELVQAISDVESVIRTERSRPVRQSKLLKSLNIQSVSTTEE